MATRRRRLSVPIHSRRTAALQRAHLTTARGARGEVLGRYNAAQLDMVKRLSSGSADGGGGDASGADDGSAAVNRHRHIHQLNGALDACRENAKWVAVLAHMARDDRTRHRPDRPVRPRGIHLRTALRRGRRPLLLLRLRPPHLPSGDLRLPVPPRARRLSGPRHARRPLGRAVAPRGGIPADAGPGVRSDGPPGGRRGGEQEEDEDVRFVRGGVRSAVDSVGAMRGVRGHAARSCGRQRCLFERCRFKTKAYCPHLGRRFVCDAPYSCETLCRMSRGNGEVATELVETLRPALLLIDFDRTLCSNKAGASPLPSSSAAPAPSAPATAPAGDKTTGAYYY